MKKFKPLMIIVIISLLISLAACSISSGPKNVHLEGNILSWDIPDVATKYEVQIKQGDFKYLGIIPVWMNETETRIVSDLSEFIGMSIGPAGEKIEPGKTYSVSIKVFRLTNPGVEIPDEKWEDGGWSREINWTVLPV